MRSRLFLTLFPAMLLGSCIDDPAAVDDQFALTQEDAALLGLTFWQQALEAQLEAVIDGPPASASASPMRAPEIFTNADTTVVACGLAGTVQEIFEVTITVDDETGELEVDAEMTLTHDGCREEIDGRTYSFYGAESILIGSSSSFDSESTQTLSGRVDGAVIVITEGAPVLCTADVVVGPGVVLGDSVTYDIRGTFCGESFDRTVTEAAG